MRTIPTPRRLAHLVLLLGLAGCIDYGISKPEELEEGGEGDGGDGGDGDVGSPLPDSCGEPSVEAEVAINEACVSTAETGSLTPIEEWAVDEFMNYPAYDQVLMAPVVGPLFDNSGDGVVDRSDRPTIVVVTDDDYDDDGKHGVLRLISGADGSSEGEIVMVEEDDYQVFPYRYSNVALGDVDADGSPEIVVLVELVGFPTGGGGEGDTAEEPGDPDTGGEEENPILPDPPATPLAPPPAANADVRCALAAFDVSGTLEWVAADTPFDCAGHAPSLADVDADGKPEAVLGRTILNGEDGSLQAAGAYDEGRYYAYTEIGLHSVVSDLDGDGVQEVIAGRSVYAPDGSQVCMGDGPTDGFAAVADLDLDGQGEFVVVGNGVVSVFDTDCTTLHSWELGDGGNGGPPAIGDLDGDGVPEIALPSATLYQAFEVDGTLLWQTEVSDVSSHATGSLIFDFESDGQPEVVYADEVALHIFDGATGVSRYGDDRHSSRTLHDYPTVADVDKDGVAEIIVPNGGGHYDKERRGIYVLGSASDSWQPGRPVWNQHAYSITNVDGDLGIPASPEPNWPDHNNFRSGDLVSPDDGLWPDAVPVARVCTADCETEGELVLDIAIANQGAGELRAEVPLYAWYEDASGLPHDLTVEWSDDIVVQGEMSPAVRLRLPAEDLDEATVYVAADLDQDLVGYADECDEGNNVLTVTEASCP